MSADFWAGYVSGAIGIIVGNPLDLIKTRVQAGDTATRASSPTSLSSTFHNAGTLVRGATAPILGYGALNAILFVSYNRTLSYLDPLHTPNSPSTDLAKIYAAGCVGGLATFIVSAPTELIKCRAQVARDGVGVSGPAGASSTSSLTIAKEIWKQRGLRGLYFGGAITSVRDAVGYGFYFWSYEISRQMLASRTTETGEARSSSAMEVLLCGGIAGMVTWASIFPLDMIKTRVQTQPLLNAPERSPLLRGNVVGAEALTATQTKGAIQIAREVYRNEGLSVFFRGLGVCTVRGFIVNAVQWFVYEWMIKLLQPVEAVGPTKILAASVERI